MLDSSIDIIPLAAPALSPRIDELLDTLDRLEALQSLELQRLRLLIDRSSNNSSPAAGSTRQPDFAFRSLRAA